MTTRNIVPRADGEGGIGTSAKRWNYGYFKNIDASISAKAKTLSVGDNSNNIATTAYVKSCVPASVGSSTIPIYTNANGVVTTSNASVGDTNTPVYMDGGEIKSTGKSFADYAPVGCVQAFAGSSTPSGWLFCDGSAVSRVTYADLFAVIGTTYGSGDGSTTFNLPDLVDKFVEGSATSGTEHSAGLPNITGVLSLVNSNVFFNQNSAQASGVFGTMGSVPNAGNYNVISSGTGKNSINFDASQSNAIYGASNTVQPPSVTMRYIIKY